ncbi:MAG TPA: winged helix-turn-helix transcriptional regulator [Solirubrobacterales bacterium]|nr:winged helix-turn-helix transcriptional regulator [Solirubrobacterales bacterium]
MTGKRRYDDACRFAHALDLVGERWALLVVRELLLGPKRFTDLRAGLPNASPNVLSQRLRELESAGVIRRRMLAPPAASRVYELTGWGRELEPVVTHLGRWGARAPVPPDSTCIGGDSIVLALRSLFDPEAAAGVKATCELRLGDDVYRVGVADGKLDLARGPAAEPEAVLRTDPDTFAAVLTGALKLTDAARSGAVEIDGPRRAVARLLELFPMPEPAVLARA